MQFDISKIVSKLTIFTSMPIRPFGERCLLICLQGAFLAPSMPPSYGTNFSGCCLDHAVDDIASENVSKVLFQLQICLQANCGPVYHTVDDIDSQDASKVPFQLQKCLQKYLQGAFLAPKMSPSLYYFYWRADSSTCGGSFTAVQTLPNMPPTRCILSSKCVSKLRQ